MPDKNPTEPLRIDKWLWAARFFKTRALAAQAVQGGKVQVNGQRVKASRAVAIGDELEIHRAQEVYVVIVRGMLAQRGPATVAQTLYEETPESQVARVAAAEQQRFLRLQAVHTSGRPTKRDRRQIRSFLGKD